MSVNEKAVVTCALTGVLTDPAKFNVPVTPDEMAAAAAEAHDAGASILHCHFRDQRPGLGAFPTWDLQMVGDILDAIKKKGPGHSHLHEHRGSGGRFVRPFGLS